MRPTKTSLHTLGQLAAAGIIAAGLLGSLQARADDDPWPDIHKTVFDNREIVEGDGAVTLEAPYRAEDAALVPLTMRIPSSIAGTVRTLTLIIDKNPAPVAATFTFGSGSGSGERVLSTRVRIDMYSNVRAVIETSGGTLHMATKFVKASGGCSAPAGKDLDEALASMGKIQVKTLAAADPSAGSALEGLVMIRHPNFTGMQMDQITRDYTPAKFVNLLEVKRGADLVLRMESGISISENPNLRFTYAGDDDDTLDVVAKDTDGNVFTGRSMTKGS